MDSLETNSLNEQQQKTTTNPIVIVKDFISANLNNYLDSGKDKQIMTDASTSEQNNHTISTMANNFDNSPFLPEDEEFYELELRDIKLKILKRYTDISVIGAGAQGLVL